MNEETAILLSEMLESSRTVYVRTEPEIMDFTDNVLSKVVIFSANSKVELEVSSQNIASVIGLLDATIFNREVVHQVYFWNFKSLASFVKYCTTKFVTPQNNVVDLKVVEAFLGIRKNPPENYIEATNRARVILQNNNWRAIYLSIHMPLLYRVIPSIETTALVNSSLRRSEFPCYEIEGQANGRLNCSGRFSRSYLPHTMGPDVRKALKPKGEGLRFATADFRFCEVVVLQWLTGDQALKEILDSGQDLHSRIYELIIQKPCDNDAKRKISKKMFLPVVYGLGTVGLAQSLGVPEEAAAEIKNRIYSKFSTALNWVNEKQQLARQGQTITDYFGRPRKYSPEECYLVRNFVVQAVAATVCQEKLIDLWKSLINTTAKLAFSVHDGYCVVFETKDAKSIYDIMKQTLESESRLCPGLKMKVEIKFGINLNEMRVLWTN